MMPRIEKYLYKLNFLHFGKVVSINGSLNFLPECSKKLLKLQFHKNSFQKKLFRYFNSFCDFVNFLNFFLTVFWEDSENYLFVEIIVLHLFTIQIIGKIYSIGIQEYYVRGFNRYWNWYCVCVCVY